MIGQTIAMLIDAYRELNARKLFWITLILSAVLVLAFALVGIDAKGLTVIKLHLSFSNPVSEYKWLFAVLIIGLWLTWAAAVLALVSTAGLFPEFISGGSIDLYLSKPIGRVRLFLTKYVAGLLFVTLQVGIVALGSYLVMGIRGHEWNAKLFLAIPIVVCFFSYLFAFCVLLGVMTRSTIAALLLTILFWALLAGLDRGEPAVLTAEKFFEAQTKSQQDRATDADKTLLRAQHDPKQAALVGAFREDSESAHREADSSAHTARNWKIVHSVAYGIKVLTPQTTDTINLLDRYIYSSEREANYAAGIDQDSADKGMDSDDPRAMTIASATKVVEDLRSRSPWRIVGASLAFEVVLVGWAMWIFCRRDY